jgi:hypothetical protein
MINVFVEILPEGEKKKGQIDQDANYDEIKKSIVQAFKLGNPKDYRLFHEPQGSRSPKDDKIQDGDTFSLIKIKRPPAFILDNEQK